MKNKFLKTTLLLVCCIPLICLNAQTSQNKETQLQDKYNYFLYKDVLHRVDVDPFLWKDYPFGLSNPKDLKDAYKLALKVGDGYRLLQLAKLEFENVYTYGNLVPSQMLHEAYQIALRNKDPYLALYITRYDSYWNLFTAYPPAKMMEQVDSLATTYKIADVLYKLAAIDDSLDAQEIARAKRQGRTPELIEGNYLMKHSTPSKVRLKALFINNPDFAPYPNLYDCPEKGKSIDETPLAWGDRPSKKINDTEFTRTYNEALQKNDGYKLLQLAEVVLKRKKFAKTASAKAILLKTYEIARYNRDPYLLLYVCLFQKETNLLENITPTDIFRQAYYTAIERRDTGALYELYNNEQNHDFLPEVYYKDIMQKELEIDRMYKTRIIYNFQK